MVQRKESNKLLVQVNHDKSEKGFGSMKVKKSKSTKLIDTMGLRSSPSKPNISIPGVLPPPSIVDDPACAAKQSTGSPNYMKSTNSFNARTERTLVSPQITRFGSDNNKGPIQKSSRSSKTNSSAENKPAIALTRSSSSKLVMTPKKDPSFKQPKLSKIASCPDVKAQRATCSSTLKDSRFPAYLMLNPGENEVDGTSVMKVCTYTYCSLNGHFHYPVPPLNSFLSTKRRLFKSQKIMEPEAANPCINKSDDGISHVKMDESIEFLIEIYARERGAAETIGSGVDGTDEQEENDSNIKMEGFDELMTPVGVEVVKYDDEEAAGSLFDESPHSEVDFEEILGPNIDTIFSRLDDTTEFFYEEFKEDDADEDYPPFFPHEEPTLQYIDNSSYAEEHSEMSGVNQSGTDASDMKSEDKFTATFLDREGDYITQNECKTDLDFTQLQIEGNTDSNLTSDGDANSCFEEILVEVRQEAFEEASTGFEESTTAEGNDRAAEKDEKDSYVISFTSGPNEEPSSEEKNVICTVEDAIVSTFPQPEDDETNYSTVTTDDTFLIDRQEDKLQQIDDAYVLHGNQTVYDHMSIKEYQNDDICNNSTKEVTNDENLLPNIEEKETPSDVATSYFVCEQQLSQTGIEDEMEYSDELNQFKLMSDTVISDPSQSCSDTEQEDSVKVGTDCCEVIQDCQHHANDENSELGQNVADEYLLSIIQEEAQERNLTSYKHIQNQNHSEKDHNEVERNSSSMNSEEQGHSDMQLSTLAEFSAQSFRNNEMEDNNMSGAATERCLGANVSASEKTRIGTFNAGININQEESSTCNNLKLVITCKRPDTDGEESITFNPRDPNFLPINADPETEKVDLRHQMEDERKNAEEWMLDYALRQAVTKLSPARSRRVALLVEAFETVKPMPKYETHLTHSSASFTGVRPVQTCI